MEILSNSLSHPPSTALFLVAACRLYCLLREPQKTQEYAEALLTFSTEHGFAQWITAGTIFQGWALVESGGGESKIEQIRKGLNGWQAIGIELAHPFFRGLIAEGCIKVGLIEKGLEEINAALQKVEQTGERESESRLHQLKGELILMQRNTDKKMAEDCFLKALKISRQQRAKSTELQVTISLCRLMQTQGRQEEARCLLSEIYDWFTEGFETVDLKDAETLLRELS